MFSHEPVLLREVLSYCKEPLSKQAVFVDATAGGGGHAEALLEAYENASALCFDRDEAAVERVKLRLGKFGDRARVQKAKFSELEATNFNVLLADLGVSSYQLDEPERGFAKRLEGPLDMRMSVDSELTAERVLNEYAPGELTRVLKRGGVGAQSFRLAKEIVSARPLHTTADLRAVCERASTKKDLSSVCFQAVRMEVNNELKEIESLLEFGKQGLAPGGYFLVISFHSNEDKLVAGTFREWSRGVVPSRNNPVEVKGLGELLTAKAIKPSEEEIKKNSRARSALLRVFKFYED